MSILKQTKIAINVLRIGNHLYGFDCLFTEKGVPVVTMSFQYVNIGDLHLLTEEDIRMIENKFTESLDRLYKKATK